MSNGTESADPYRYCREHPYQRYKPRINWLEYFAMVMFVGMVIGFISGLCALSQSENKREKFIRQCIEFQTVDRCNELYNWQREDLMRQNGYR